MQGATVEWLLVSNGTLLTGDCQNTNSKLAIPLSFMPALLIIIPITLHSFPTPCMALQNHLIHSSQSLLSPSPPPTYFFHTSPIPITPYNSSSVHFILFLSIRDPTCSHCHLITTFTYPFSLINLHIHFLSPNPTIPINPFPSL